MFESVGKFFGTKFGTSGQYFLDRYVDLDVLKDSAFLTNNREKKFCIKEGCNYIYYTILLTHILKYFISFGVERQKVNLVLLATLLKVQKTVL